MHGGDNAAEGLGEAIGDEDDAFGTQTANVNGEIDEDY